MKVKNIINGFISGLLASITGMILISVILSQVTLEESLIQLYNQKKLGSYKRSLLLISRKFPKFDENICLKFIFVN